MADTYRRVVITQPGSPNVLQLIEEPIPQPAAGEVRIRVQAAGVAYGDVIAREGISDADKLPYTPGYDAVGTIDALGEGVTAFDIGQTVAVLMDTGGYAEVLCKSATDCVPVPDGLDAVDAVSIVLNGLTAYQMLHRIAHVQPGERILVHGAGGGVGTMFLQLGKLANLQVFGTASQRKHEMIRAFDATPIDYRTEDFVKCIHRLTDDGVDAVFDGIGGAYWERSFQCLRPGGRLVLYGRSSVLKKGHSTTDSLAAFQEAIPQFSPMDLFTTGKAVMGYYVTLFKRLHPDWYRADLQTLFNDLQAGSLQAIVGARFPLEQAADAHRLMDDAAIAGKIVLTTSAYREGTSR